MRSRLAAIRRDSTIQGLLALVLRELRQVRFAHRASEREVGLLVVLNKDLERGLPGLINNFIYGMDDAFDSVLLAPDSSGKRPSFLAELRSGDLVPSGTLHRRDIEAELVASLESARDVEVGIALKAGDASAGIFSQLVVVVLVLAKLADGFIARRWNQLEAFRNLELLRIAEADLWREDSAIDMDPIVASGSLERFARQYWPVERELLVVIV